MQSFWVPDPQMSSASDELCCVQSSKKASDDSLTHATLDMLEQLSSPAERSARLGPLPKLCPSNGQPGHSSKVSTDMESICEAKMLPGSLSPLSSAPSPLSLRCPASNAQSPSSRSVCSSSDQRAWQSGSHHCCWLSCLQSVGFHLLSRTCSAAHFFSACWVQQEGVLSSACALQGCGGALRGEATVC